VEQADQPSFIAIARIARTRGNRGEVLADLYTDFPERFDSLEEVWLEWPNGTRERARLESCWYHKGRQVLKFAGTDSISSAERLVGAWLKIERAEAVSLPDGTYFDHDLVGCSVYSLDGKELGTVKEVLRISGNNQLVIAGGHGEFLLPAVAGFCRDISIEDRKILVELPEGLIDLNK
jgi:16S rRNA processing protein RimM